ncbi:hypothetical protein HPB50_023814 [Hyalomma asiaticum]|uniref:Uncharacterized protein n=1 Tax=Hyalomma asiaticum TaxID=266040 RepID=A0ACB7SNU0_HYAAI|nr:hypothetical protein HPB50_023814 [Hyalomma asiaticum]
MTSLILLKISTAAEGIGGASGSGDRSNARETHEGDSSKPPSVIVMERATRERPLPLGSLICTVQPPFTANFMHVPPDGLFCGSSADMTKLVTDPKTKKALDLLWSKRVYHYAQVNPPIGFPGELRNVVPNCGKGLKSLFDLMKDKSDNVDRPSYTIYSFPLYEPTNFPEVGGFLSASPVDIFIAHAYHSEEDAGFPECHMIPPTLFTKQLLSPDVYDLYSIRLGCSKKSYNDSLMVDPVFQAMVGYDKNEGWLFTFDSGETLRQKLCEAKSNVTDLQLNIVASNIGSEDYLNQCGLGPLPRLRMLKALSLFFAHNYTSSADKSRCLMVTG